MSDSGDTVTISKHDLNLLQGSWKLLNGLWDHPEHGAVVKRAAKAVDPTLRVPEIDVAEPMLAPIRAEIEEVKKSAAEVREENARLRQEREEERQVADLGKALDAAQKKYRLTDDGMAEVKKLMAERHINDPPAAAAFVVSEIEPAAPMTGSNFAPQDANVFGIDGTSDDKDIAALHNDPVRWLDKAVPAIMAEFEQESA
jgi:hypothetical protein